MKRAHWVMVLINVLLVFPLRPSCELLTAIQTKKRRYLCLGTGLVKSRPLFATRPYFKPAGHSRIAFLAPAVLSRLASSPCQPLRRAPFSPVAGNLRLRAPNETLYDISAASQVDCTHPVAFLDAIVLPDAVGASVERINTN